MNRPFPQQCIFEYRCSLCYILHVTGYQIIHSIIRTVILVQCLGFCVTQCSLSFNSAHVFSSSGSACMCCILQRTACMCCMLPLHRPKSLIGPPPTFPINKPLLFTPRTTMTDGRRRPTVFEKYATGLT